MVRTLVSLALLAPAAALACPGAGQMAASADDQPALASADMDPTHCAKDSGLVGAGCSYRTNLMAQRVHAEGKDLTVTGKLEKTDAALASEVAAPWTIDGLRVIANTVAESLDTSAPLALNGKVLEVEGVKYLLVTSATKANS